METYSPLSKKAIEEYQSIYLKTFGKEISYGEANQQGIKLLRLFKIIYQPIYKKWIEKK
ncbi:MAG: hypothetical protein WCT77_01010 [Bacteroidota bacterium]